MQKYANLGELEKCLLSLSEALIQPRRGQSCCMIRARLGSSGIIPLPAARSENELTLCFPPPLKDTEKRPKQNASAPERARRARTGRRAGTGGKRRKRHSASGPGPEISNGHSRGDSREPAVGRAAPKNRAAEQGRTPVFQKASR